MTLRLTGLIRRADNETDSWSSLQSRSDEFWFADLREPPWDEIREAWIAAQLDTWPIHAASPRTRGDRD